MKFLFIIALGVCVLLTAPSWLFGKTNAPRTVQSSLSARAINQEADPEDERACFSMGRIIVDYTNGEPGLPTAGFRIADPRGREIGFDARTQRGWQDMPLAEAYAECEQNEDTGEVKQCKDHIEICGPISGTYQVELFSAGSGNFSVNVTAASSRSRSGSDFAVTTSHAEIDPVIGEQGGAVILLQYSREAGTQVKLLDKNQHVAGK